MIEGILFFSSLDKILLLLFLLYFGTAYALTQNRSNAMLAAIAYFILRYLVSENNVIDQCFE